MPNQNNIQLSLAVDISQAVADVKQFGGELKSAVANVGKEIESVDNLDFGKNLGEDFDGINVTIKELLDRLDDLKEKFQNAAIGGEAWQRWGNEIKTVEGKLNEARTAFEKQTTAVKTGQVAQGAFRTAMMQSTYAIAQINPMVGDFVYALQPMISGFSTASAKGQGFKAMLGAIGGQIMGPLGIAAGVGILISVITTLIKSHKDAGEAAKEQEDALRSLRTEMEKMSKETLRLGLAVTQRTLGDLVAGIVKAGGEISEEQNTQLDKLRQQENAYKTQLTILGDLNQLENERIELNKELGGLKGIDPDQGPLSPHALARATEIRNRLKEIDESLKSIDVSTPGGTPGGSSGDETRQLTFLESYRLKNQELRTELAQLRVDLQSTNLTFAESSVLHQREAEIIKMLTANTSEYLALFQLIEKLKPKQSKEITMEFVAPVPAPDIIKETNFALESQIALVDSLTEGFNNAGSAVASAFGSSVHLLKNNNSLLQIFINNLGSAIAQAIGFKIVMAALNFLTGGFSGLFGGGASQAFDDGGLFRGIPGRDKNLAKISDHEYIVNARSTKKHLALIEAINKDTLPAYGGGGLNLSRTPVPPYSGYSGGGVVYQTVIQPIAVDVTGKIGNREIYLSGRKEANWRRKYTGA